MGKDELLMQFEEFINENGLWTEFIAFLAKKGYSEDDCTEAIES